MTYRIVRHYMDSRLKRKVLGTGLTLEEARAHCNDPQTASHTATTKAAAKHTDLKGPWFDGYEKENN
jgi:hypothetical protein